MKLLNIYKLSQNQNSDYDTYDSCIVIAKDEVSARCIHPSGYSKWFNDDWCNSPDNVTVELIGKALKGSTIGLVLASFNALQTAI